MHPLHTARVGDLRLVATTVPAGSWLVRIHPDEGAHYDRMILVTEEEGGRVLHLAGWIGEPLTPAEWSAARDALFPKAETVRFDRLRGGGFIHRALQLASADTKSETAR